MGKVYTPIFFILFVLISCKSPDAKIVSAANPVAQPVPEYLKEITTKSGTKCNLKELYYYCTASVIDTGQLATWTRQLCMAEIQNCTADPSCDYPKTVQVMIYKSQEDFKNYVGDYIAMGTVIGDAGQVEVTISPLVANTQ